MISYIKHKDIDQKRWDTCIDLSSNGQVYALSWYLNEVCPGWDAIVYKDYEFVLPLPVRRKWGVSYVFAPIFTQQLGVFGKHPNTRIVEQMLTHIPRKYRIVDIRLNEENRVGNKKFNPSRKANHIIPLRPPYEEVLRRYNRNCKRNIKKAQNAGFTVHSMQDASYFARFIGKHLQEQGASLSPDEIARLERVTQAGLDHKCAELLSVLDTEQNILAMGSFFFYHDRVLFSVCASSPAGKKQQAMYLLVNHQIQKSATHYELYDFSGSELPGVAYFNSTFGAVDKGYTLIQMHRLPRIILRVLGKQA